MARLALLFIAAAAAYAQFTTSLSPETTQAFDDYLKTNESKMTWQGKSTGNDVQVSASNGKSPVEVKHGMIHDWTASVFVPGATTEKALRVFQNYAAYQNLFAPEVAESKLLGQDGRHFHAFLKLRRKKVITAVLNSEYDVEYRPLDNGRWAIISRSTKIAEVDGEKELPVGQGHGYLWRLNAYWVLEPRSGGLYMECRSISLTRDLPTGLGWAVRPIVASLPKESLQATVESARAAIR